MKSNTNQAAFLETVYQWLQEDGEVLIFEHITGGISPNLFTSQEQIHQWIRRLNQLWEETQPYLIVRDAFAMKNYDFSLRGIVDEVFISSAAKMMREKEGSEFLLLELGENAYYHLGDSFTESSTLITELSGYLGMTCVFGKYPPISANPIPNQQLEASFPIML